MLLKQLRFSIALLLITINSNCYLINASVIQSNSHPGWSLHNLDTYPPKVEDDSYLYYYGQTSDLKGLKIEVKEVPKGLNESDLLTRATVSFNYWGYGGEPQNYTDGYTATSLFSLGVSFHSEAKPDTVWAEFDSTNLGNKVGDSWTPFTATSDSPLYPARIMITPTVANPDPSESYYVALRGIQVVYFFSHNEMIAENKTDPATGEIEVVNVMVPTERNVTLECTPNSCSDFIITNSVNYYWSYLFFPTKPTSFKNFLTPNGDLSDGSSSEPIGPYSLTVSKDEATDVCVSINYWLTEGTNLTVTLGSSTATFVLSPTYSVPTSTSIEVTDSMYDWYKIKLCLSDFMFNLPAGNYTISLSPSPVSPPNFIAVGEIGGELNDVQTPNLPTQMAKMILESWSKDSIEPKSEWAYLPDIVAVEPNSLVFEAYPDKRGIIYLMSDWFNLTSGLELHQEMFITDCPPRISVQLQLIDSENNLVATQQSDLCSSDNALKSKKVYFLTQGVQNEAHRVQFVLDWTPTQQASLNLSSVDLSDGCRRDRAECFNHGTCTVSRPNVAKCDCDFGYTGDNCKDPNWCELQFTLDSNDSLTQINGSDYCTERQGFCDKVSFEPKTRPICECGLTKYWKYDEQLGHSCADLDPCAGVNVFCEMGYTCVSINGTTSCSGCDTDYHDDGTGKCVKTSPCDQVNCAKGADCKVYEGTAICTCPNGIRYDSVNGCDTTDSSCTLDQRRSLGCEHTCSLVLGKPTCNCLSGWNQTDLDSKKCEATFNCTANCPTSPGSVCIVNGDQSQCTCLPDYVKLPDVTVNGTTTPNYECVDICKGSQLNITEAMNHVRSICGTSTCSMDKQGSLICTCDPPYVTGSDGRCHIDTACLPGGEGYSSCSSLGAICQPNLEATAPWWTCQCPIGTVKLANGSCVDQCSIGGKDCLFDNAICQPSTNPKATKHECVCQPGLKKNETDKRCYLIEHSMRVEMVIRLNEKMITSTEQQVKKQFTSFYMQAPQLSTTCPTFSPLDIPGCIYYHIRAADEKYSMQRSALMDRAIRSDLISILKSDLSNVYGNTFDDINVVHYAKLSDNGTTSLAGDYRVILSLELTDPNMKIDQVLQFEDKAVCHNLAIASSSSYCFIPLQSVLKRGSIFRGELLPCNESYIDYCPSNTRCNPLDSSRFSCDCNPGFKAETIIQMDVTDRDNYYKEYCEDIDECSTLTNPCRDHSTCVNTIGGHLCPCNHEYIEDRATGSCINVCSTVKCAYGECHVVANNTGLCRCHEGYRGETCEEQDPMVTTFRTALITVAVILSLLLVGVVLVAVILIKKTKRSAMKQNAERPMAEYGRAQVPKRYQDNSGFTND